MSAVKLTKVERETLERILRAGGQVRVVPMARAEARPREVTYAIVNDLFERGLVRAWSEKLSNGFWAECAYDIAVTAKGCAALAEESE